MPQTHVRVPGGGNTYFHIGLKGSRKVEFLANYVDTSGTAISQATPIQPIGSVYPVEIATAYGQNMGTLTLTFWNTWGHDGWVSAFMYDNGQNTYSINDAEYPWRGYDSAGSGVTGIPVDLYEVLDAQRKLDEYITVRKFELGSNAEIVRGKSYEKAIITNIGDEERVANNTVESQCTVTINYTNKLVTYL